jgi:hypothetical protein
VVDEPELGPDVVGSDDPRPGRGPRVADRGAAVGVDPRPSA